MVLIRCRNFRLTRAISSILMRWFSLYITHTHTKKKKTYPDAVCMQVQKRPYKECAGEKVPNITSECVGLRETYFNCKRGQACPHRCIFLLAV
jgi:hypothetical protein